MCSFFLTRSIVLMRRILFENVWSVHVEHVAQKCDIQSLEKKIRKEDFSFFRFVSQFLLGTF
jgi:hypothetical protein